MRVMFLFCSPPPWAKVLIIPHIKSHGQNAVCLKSAAELPGSRFGEQMDGILAFSKGTSYLRHWGFQWIGVNISGQPTLHCEAVIPSQFKYCRHKFSKKHPLLVQMLLWFGSWTNTFFLFLSFSLFGVWPSGKKKVRRLGWRTGHRGGKLEVSPFHFLMPRVGKEARDCVFSCYDEKPWGTAKEILFTFGRAVGLWLWRGRVSLLTGGAHSPPGTGTAAIDWVAASSVRAFTPQPAVGSIVACLAFCGGRRKNRNNSDMLSTTQLLSGNERDNESLGEKNSVFLCGTFALCNMLRHKRESPWVANRRVGVRTKLLRKIGHRESEDSNFYF